MDPAFSMPGILIALFIVSQILYLLTFLVDFYLLLLPINRVDMDTSHALLPDQFPFIVLFYPVLRELEATMRTTLTALARMDYPADRFRVVAIPNADDHVTIAALTRLQRDFPFMDLTAVPDTSDPSWRAVWDAWDANDKVYWWHRGPRAKIRDLPPKKTRQLIYAFYTTAEARAGMGDFLVNYIDADSAPPRDHFRAAAVGIQQYDVLQSENIAGNLNASMAASWHAFDHMTWDGRKYAHLSADGRHPYWVLGKGLFFKASDLIALGGFHPWVTIEDPEVGMRFWINGRKLGVIENPLIEEVPETIAHGIKQRRRWVAGFFQSLNTPLKEMGFTRGQRLRAWLNFLPCLSLWVNVIGLPVGIWALWLWYRGVSPLPFWTVFLAAFNVFAYVAGLLSLYASTWRRTAMVLDRRRDRLWYLLRVNPVSLMIWWTIWLVPLWQGWRMYRRDEGLVWERTEKTDANSTLVRGSNDPATRPALVPDPVRRV